MLAWEAAKVPPLSCLSKHEPIYVLSTDQPFFWRQPKAQASSGAKELCLSSKFKVKKDTASQEKADARLASWLVLPDAHNLSSTGCLCCLGATQQQSGDPS
ncbi:TPA: hypothetical protein ACH3X2_000269 [Trebouxia sp. C0005]